MGTGMKMGNFLQFPGDSQVGGRQNGGICIRCVQERREGSPAACSILRKGREVWAAGAQAALKIRKPERNKNGRKTFGGGWACILAAQGSIGPSVPYCGFQAIGRFWKQVCDMGTMVAEIQRSICPRDAIKEKVLELHFGGALDWAFPSTDLPIWGWGRGENQSVYSLFSLAFLPVPPMVLYFSVNKGAEESGFSDC